MADLRNGLRTGLVFGLILLFLALIGFPFVVAQILTGLLASRTVATGTPASLLLTLGLLGFWAGSTRARLANRDNNTGRGAVIRGLAAGATSGSIFAVFIFVIATQRAMDVDLRHYLYQLSPDAVSLYTLGQSPIVATLIMFGLLITTSALGSAVGYGLGFLRAGEALRGGWSGLGDASNKIPTVGQVKRSLVVRYVLFGVLGIALLVIPLFLNSYWVFILGTVGIYVLIGLGLNIVVGFAGLLDLGYVAFYAVGAYTVAILTAPAPKAVIWGFEWSFWIALLIGIVLAGIAGLLLGIPVLRLRGDYLAIVTLGFGEIIRVLAKSDALTWFTAGPQGIPTVGKPELFGRSIGDISIFGKTLGDPLGFLYFIMLGIVLAIFIGQRLQHSRVGRAWVAIREDETVAQAMGINTFYYKLLAFGIGAAFAGLGGVLFASRNGFTGPEDFVLMVSINVLALVIVGGMGSIPGVILGAFILKGMPEILRQFEDFRIIAFGALLVTMMLVRPQGLWPSARRRLEMHIEKAEPVDEQALSPSREGVQ